MPILLNSSGRRVLKRGKLRMGNDGEGCCCWIEATPCVAGSARVWVDMAAIAPLSGDSRMWFYYPTTGKFYSVAVTDPQSTPGANKVTTTPSDRRRGCPVVTAYYTGEERTGSYPSWTDNHWFYNGNPAVTSISESYSAPAPDNSPITSENGNLPAGNYTFTTTVNLNPYVDLSLVRLYLRVLSVDNAFVGVTVNGTAAGIDPTALVGLVLGDNTIAVTILNTGGPTGVRLNWTVGAL